MGIIFSVLEILLGILTDNDHSFMCNYLILKGKVFIYQNKMNEDLFFLEFLRKLKIDIFTEKTIYKKKNDLETFNRKFRLFYDHL